MAVDPIELRKKLRRMGIGAGFENSQEFALDAAKGAVAHQTLSKSDPRVPANPLELDEVAYMVHNWAMQWSVPA